jgi:predicted TIM-barrel fold metal-dependent hydrolase
MNWIAVIVGCVRAPGAVEPSVAELPRSRIVPLVDHHQHLVGPMQVEAPEPPLPPVELPPELDRVLRERERISGTTTPSALYTEDVRVLDISSGADRWVTGRDAAQRMAAAYTSDTWFVPHAFRVDGASAHIVGTTRTGESMVPDMNFLLVLVRDPGGEWRIAVEYATSKPPPTFTDPITGDALIGHLDDAGIERAVVLSVAYWFGSPLDEAPPDPDERQKVAAANDWTVAEAAKYPERLVAFCGVNLLADYALDEVARCAALPDVKGLKVHFGNSAVDLKDPEHVAQVRRFFRAANDGGLAIVAHLWTLDPTYGADHSRIFLEEVLPEAPDVTVQIAHFAGGGRYVHDDALAVFADAITAGDPRMANVLFDLTTVIDESLTDETVALVATRIRQIGLERIVYGSDTAVPSRPPPVLAWAIFRRRIPLTDDEVRAIADNVAPYLR